MNTQVDRATADSFDVDWDQRLPTTPTELGSRSGEVVSANADAGETLAIRVQFPNGCTITGDFNGVNGLVFVPGDTEDDEFIDTINFTDTSFEDNPKLTTLPRQRAELLFSHFDIDPTVHSEIENYLDRWEQIINDHDARPLHRQGLESVTWSSVDNNDTWRGTLRFEPGPDFLGIRLIIYFDPTPALDTEPPPCASGTDNSR